MKSKSTTFSDSSAADNILSSNSCIYVAGHEGMVGSAIVRRLQAAGHNHLITRTRKEVDLTDQRAVTHLFADENIDAVILAAAKVGGIHANNSYPAEFIYQNIMIQTNIVHAAFRTGVKRLLFLGSSCIYPKHAPQPLREDYLLSGYLEPTNEPYAIAKIAGIKLCEAYNRQYGTRFRSVMPTNLYGPNDNFDLETSHVLPAMIRKFHLAKLAVQDDWQGIRNDEAHFGRIPDDIRASLTALSQSPPDDSSLPPPAVRLWGSGMARREFLHVDDLAAACIFLLDLSDEQYEAATTADQTSLQMEAQDATNVSHINIGSGSDSMIRELAEMVKEVVAYPGEIFWDRSKPDGTPRKLMDTARLNALGWKPGIDLREGIQRTYTWYLEQTGKR
jgi:GDP-L-fucose synthase